MINEWSSQVTAEQRSNLFSLLYDFGQSLASTVSLSLHFSWPSFEFHHLRRNFGWASSSFLLTFINLTLFMIIFFSNIFDSVMPAFLFFTLVVFLRIFFYHSSILTLFDFFGCLWWFYRGECHLSDFGLSLTMMFIMIDQNSWPEWGYRNFLKELFLQTFVGKIWTEKVCWGQ